MSPPSELDMTRLSPEKKGRSKLLMKNRRAGRKSLSLIHCIPKFSKVLPNKNMSEAQKALLTKIKSKQNETDCNEEDEYPEDLPVERYRGDNNLTFHNFSPPELTIEPARRRPRHNQQCVESSQPEITIIPKYPQLLPAVTPAQQNILSTMQMLVLRKEDYEALLPTNPVFSSYIFLPSLSLFVHPLVFPTQFLPLPPSSAQGEREQPPAVFSDNVTLQRAGPHSSKQLVVTNTKSTQDGATFCTLKNFSN